MGNFEKVVVLLILLVCAAVLGVSLRPGDPIEEVSATDHGRPGGSAAAESAATPQLAPAEAAARPATLPPAPAKTAVPPVVDGLLSALIASSGDREVALETADGLAPTSSPDFLVYVCRAEDTWLSLAKRFYGDKARVELLRTANETVEEPRAGQQIQVPVYDLVLDGLRREPTRPRELRERFYEVREGDTLSSISKALFGTGARWMQIYDANRDVLGDPDVLRVGTRLKVPE